MTALKWKHAAAAALLAACACALQAQADANWARVRDVHGADLIVLEDGRRVRLTGVSLPAPSVRPDGFAERLREWLREQLAGKDVVLEPEPQREAGETADVTAVVRTAAGGPSINEQALQQGLAVLRLPAGPLRAAEPLLAAARAAQHAQAGWFGGKPARLFAELPYLNGCVVGLYRREPVEVPGLLDEVAGLGFRHVTFLFAAFLQRHDAHRIDRHHPRTPRDAHVLAAIRHAKSKGLSVTLLPIVLLEEDNGEWRGTLKPKDEDRFWLEYDRFANHYLDLAEAGGAEMFSLGSELGSLEPKTARWLRIIDNARGRFRGLLTYSTNWDHTHEPRFYDRLDVIGMTAYFTLTKKNDPTVEELVEAWRGIARKHADLARFGKPVIFTELGYASLDGINTNPWDYVKPKRVDLGEQRDCFEAFLRVAPEIGWLKGAYLFDYTGAEGPDDGTYSPRGKPALEQWRRWATWR
jgi:hypothetical protein